MYNITAYLPALQEGDHTRVRLKGKEKYLIEIFTGKCPFTGKKLYHRETFCGNRTMAKLREAELNAKLKRTQGPKSKQRLNTLGELMQKWLVHNQGEVSRRTYETYGWHVTKLMPIVGELLLYHLTAYDVAETMRTGCATLPLSDRSKKGMYGTLRTVLRTG